MSGSSDHDNEHLDSVKFSNFLLVEGHLILRKESSAWN
jgi:hypothetical protein